MTKESRKTTYFPRLRELRLAAGLNQMDIADLLGMQQNQYSRYERGERQLPMHHFMTLALHYKTSLDYIVGLKDER